MRSGWWRFWRKRATEFDITTVANLPILTMLEKKHPFDKWCPPSVKLEGKYEAVVRSAVLAYQVHLYNKLIELRFGAEAASLARAHQIIALNRVDQMGDEFRKLLTLVEEGVNSPPMKAPTEQGEITIPVEMNIALWFLVRSGDSPYYMNATKLSARKMPKIEDEIDWHFAECLEFGKGEALRAFSPIIDKVTLTQASVSGLRVSTIDGHEDKDNRTQSVHHTPHNHQDHGDVNDMSQPELLLAIKDIGCKDEAVLIYTKRLKDLAPEANKELGDALKHEYTFDWYAMTMTTLKTSEQMYRAISRLSDAERLNKAVIALEIAWAESDLHTILEQSVLNEKTDSDLNAIAANMSKEEQDNLNVDTTPIKALAARLLKQGDPNSQNSNIGEN